MDTSNKIDHTDKKKILGYMSEITQDYGKALDYWKDYVTTRPPSDNDQTPFREAIKILINSQSDKPVFFELLRKHVQWMSRGLSTLQKLFAEMRVDTIKPEMILEKLKELQGSPDYDLILENFYNTMIRVHKRRSEQFHTDLAKIYLQKALKGVPGAQEEFRYFIRDPTSW